LAEGPEQDAGSSRLESTLDSLARDTSRRGFLARVGGALVAATAGGVVSKAVKPGEADAFHFCGHIFTTGSCPHPTGLPRIDARGMPLRSDGRAIDNLGRLINGAGEPISESGAVRTDPDGRALPPAPRSQVCDEVGKKFNFKTWVDGGWYRCCGGQVRKLVDCCAYSNRRINGDQALRGYCFSGRKVFCVMYFQTKVPC
jgi:hypothetical protein